MRYAVLSVLLLAGCQAVIPQTMSNLKVSKSQEAYRTCVLAHPTDSREQCQSQKEIFDLDMAAYRATMGK